MKTARNDNYEWKFPAKWKIYTYSYR